MAKVVGEVAIDVTADIGPLVKQMKRGEAAMGGLKGAADRAGRGLNAFGDQSIKLGKGLSVISAGMAAAGAAAFALVNNVAGAGDVIAKTSRGAGVSGRYFQEMAFALGQVASVSQGELAAGMTRVTRLMGEAQLGSKQAIEAFDLIGISQADIASGAVDTEAAFNKLVQTLSDTSDPAMAAAISTAVLGKAGADLGPKLAGSAGAIADLRNRANELGIVMSGDALSASEKFGDQMDDVKKGFEGLKIAIANELLPVFTNVLLPAMTDKVIPALQQVASKIGDVIGWFADLPGPVQEAVAVVGAALGLGGPILVGVGLVSKALGALVLATGPIGLFIAAAGLIVAAWMKWGDDIKRIVSGAAEWMVSAFTTALDFYLSLPARFIQIGRDIVMGLWNGLQEAFSEFSPVEALKGLGSSMIDGLKGILRSNSPSMAFHEIGMDVGLGLRNGIVDSFGMVRDAVSGLGQQVTGGAFDMAKGVVDAMGQMFAGSKPIAAAQALINTFQGMTEALKLPFPKNLAAAAKVAAQGFAAVKGIQSARPGSSGGGAAAASSAAGASSAPQFQINLDVIADAQGNVSSGALRGLVSDLQNQLNRGQRVIA